MPSLIEINETNTSSARGGAANSKSDEITPCSIIINECEDNSQNETKIIQENIASNSNLSVNQTADLMNKTNILEYLLNNQKSLNTKLAIANIAAAAAQSDLDENFNFSSSNHTLLQTLLMDLMAPPIAVSSQFDLSSTASTEPVDVDISLIYQHQVTNESVTASNLNNTQISGSKQVELNQTFNNSFNTNFVALNNNKKQVNDQIMRTCMGYLDYINKKHTRERQIQTIRNKISGFILLTLVFLMIFGLALVMTFCLTKIITSSASVNAPILPSTTSTNTKNFTNSPSYYVSVGVNSLKSEHMISMYKNEEFLRHLLRNEINIFVNNLYQNVFSKLIDRKQTNNLEENQFKKILLNHFAKLFQPNVESNSAALVGNSNNDSESSYQYFAFAIDELMNLKISD